MQIINSKKRKGVNLKLFVVSMAALVWWNFAIELFVRSSSSSMAEEEEAHHVQTTARRIPLIIGAGMGTTGTHLMTEATCHLGYPSMHWNVGCIPHIPDDDEIPKVYQTVAKKHASLVMTVHHAAKCILHDQDCAKVPAVMFKAQILEHINDLVQYTSESTMNTTIALHDKPYPSLMPSMIIAVKLHYNGASPVILLSERNGTEYTQRRIDTNHGLNDIMCKDSMNTSTSSSLAPSIDPETLQGGAFDIIGCIDRAVVSGFTLLDVFTTMGKVHKEQRGNDDSTSTTTIELIARNVKEYQDAVREKAALSYDMFTKKERTNKEYLAEIMVSSSETMQYGQSPCDYVNWWKMKKIEKLS